MNRTLLVASLLLLLLLPLAAAPADAPPPPTAGDPVKMITAAFAKRPVVAIAENHMIKQLGELYNNLVADGEFQNNCNDIVVEFVSRNNQPLLDRYILKLEDIPQEQLKHLWRDTFKSAAWESPIYQNWLAAIREANKALPEGKRMRVLAGDTPIDWSKIKTNADWAALGDNNVSFAAVINDEVLAKKRKALVVFGANHLTKNGDRNRDDNTATLVQKKFPNSLYVIMFFDDLVFAKIPGATPILAKFPVPAVVPIAGTPLATLKNQNGDTLDKLADAVLNLGPTSKIKPKLSDLDADSIKEIERRAKIMRPDQPELWKTIFDK